MGAGCWLDSKCWLGLSPDVLWRLETKLTMSLRSSSSSFPQSSVIIAKERGRWELGTYRRGGMFEVRGLETNLDPVCVHVPSDVLDMSRCDGGEVVGLDHGYQL